MPAHQHSTPTDHRLPPVAPSGRRRRRRRGRGRRRPRAADREGDTEAGRDGEHEPAVTGRTGRRPAERRPGLGRGRVGARTGAEARTGDGRTARPLPPPPLTTLPPPPPPSRRELRGANRGTAAARGESAQRRADAAASRGSPPGHASPGRGRARGLGLGREPPVPTGREPRGGREAGTGRGHTAGKAPQGEGGGRRAAPAGRRQTPPPRAGRRTTADRRARPHPRHHRGPPPGGARPSPAPRHPRGGDTRRPLAARGSSRRGDRPHRPRQARGLGASSRPLFSPLAGDVPPATEAGGGTPCLHLGGRRAQRPCEDSPQPRAPRGGAHRTRAPRRGD